MSTAPVPRRRGAALAILAATSMSLVACAEDIGPGAYTPYAAGSVAQVEEGLVISAQPIRFRDGESTGTGTVVGGVAGGVVGSQFGGGAAARAGLGVAGALAGAVVGNAIAKNANERNGFVYTIRVARDGRTIQVPQADSYPIPQNTRVYVSFGPDRARVQPIGGYAPPPPAYR